MKRHLAVMVTGDRRAGRPLWAGVVYDALWATIDAHRKQFGPPEQLVLVVGDASGIDEMARTIAPGMGFQVIRCDAQWDSHEPRTIAGPARNNEMVMILKHLSRVGYETQCLAFKGGLSGGTANAARRAASEGISTYLIGNGGYWQDVRV